MEFILTDWAEGLDNVKTAKADIHAGLFYTDERDEYLDFTIPLKISLPTSLFVSNTVNVTSLYNIGDIPVGVINEGFEEYFVRKNYPNAVVLEFTDQSEVIRAAEDGRISAFVSDYPTAMYYLYRTNTSERYHAVEKLYEEELFAAVPEGRKDLLEYLNYTINNFDKDRRDLIIQKWIQTVSKTPDWLIPLIAVIIIFFISAFIAVYIFTLKKQVYKRTKELEQISQTDFLTKINNRLKIEDNFRKELYRLRRYKTSLSIIMIDIDNFKKVNDSEGHSAGDQVLVKLADILAKNIRVSDSIGRWGGEEFLIICPDTDSSHAGVLAEKLRKIIEKTDFQSAVVCTASFGISEAHSDEKEYDIFQRADKALYESKASGKNRITVL